MVAESALRAGDIVFSETAFVIWQNAPAPAAKPTSSNPNQTLRRKDACAPACLAVAGHKQLNGGLRCDVCDCWFCSPSCRELHSPFHHATGECAAVSAVRAAAHLIQPEDFPTFQIVVLAAARAHAEGVTSERLLFQRSPVCEKLAGTDVLPYVVETVAAAKNSSSSSSSQPREENPTPLYDAVEALVTNFSSIRADLRDDYERLFAIYSKIITSTTLKSATWRLALPALSRDVFVGLCAAFQCNGFGVWNSSGAQIASGLFPGSSYFNHSCAPNIGRIVEGRTMKFFVTRDVAAGEPLCLSYIDFKLTRDVRRAKLLATYCFMCNCLRCADPDAIDHSAKYDTPLCASCVFRVLRPICHQTEDGPRVDGQCPCCGEVFINAFLSN